MKISMIQAIQRSANPFGKHAKNIYYVMYINKFWNFCFVSKSILRENLKIVEAHWKLFMFKLKK